jgi:hypothetical protein
MDQIQEQVKDRYYDIFKTYRRKTKEMENKKQKIIEINTLEDKLLNNRIKLTQFRKNEVRILEML